MVASTGKIGIGTALKMGDGATPTEAFATVANVVGIDGPGRSMEIVDATHLQSTGGYREKIPHLKDGGTVSLTVHYDPTHATHDEATGLPKKYEDRTLTNFQIVWPTVVGKTHSFAAYVTNVGAQFQVDDLIQMTCELTISGPVTVADTV